MIPKFLSSKKQVIFKLSSTSKKTEDRPSSSKKSMGASLAPSSKVEREDVALTKSLSNEVEVLKIAPIQSVAITSPQERGRR